MAEEERRDRLVIRKVIQASCEEVFAAWIDPKSIGEWMCPGEIVTAEAQLDPRGGGTYRIVMKGTRAIDHTGEYLVVEPPSKLAFTWISKTTGNQPTLVTVELFERGSACELVLTHERFANADEVKRHQGGWGQIVDKLARYLARRSPIRGD
ncbi:MAG TPA: SRPBCC domain-containing protein [bacterium]|nr:SRPBCC domain-containing protein [bacterium]